MHRNLNIASPSPSPSLASENRILIRISLIESVPIFYFPNFISSISSSCLDFDRFTIVKIRSKKKKKKKKKKIKQRGKRMEWRFVSSVCGCAECIQRNGSYKIMRRRGKSLTRGDGAVITMRYFISG